MRRNASHRSRRFHSPFRPPNGKSPIGYAFVSRRKTSVMGKSRENGEGENECRSEWRLRGGPAEKKFRAQLGEIGTTHGAGYSAGQNDRTVYTYWYVSYNQNIKCSSATPCMLRISFRNGMPNPDSLMATHLIVTCRLCFRLGSYLLPVLFANNTIPNRKKQLAIVSAMFNNLCVKHSMKTHMRQVDRQ